MCFREQIFFNSLVITTCYVSKYFLIEVLTVMYKCRIKKNVFKANCFMIFHHL